MAPDRGVRERSLKHGSPWQGQRADRCGACCPVLVPLAKEPWSPDTWALGPEGQRTGLPLSAKVAPMEKGGATDLVARWPQAAPLGPRGCPGSGPGQSTALGGDHAAHVATTFIVSGNGSCHHTQYDHRFLPDNGYIVSSTSPHARHRAKGFVSLIPFNSRDHGEPAPSLYR